MKSVEYFNLLYEPSDWLLLTIVLDVYQMINSEIANS